MRKAQRVRRIFWGKWGLRRVLEIQGGLVRGGEDSGRRTTQCRRREQKLHLFICSLSRFYSEGLVEGL